MLWKKLNQIRVSYFPNILNAIGWLSVFWLTRREKKPRSKIGAKLLGREKALGQTFYLHVDGALLMMVLRPCE